MDAWRSAVPGLNVSPSKKNLCEKLHDVVVLASRTSWEPLWALLNL
jgi:hypothetical protein